MPSSVIILAVPATPNVAKGAGIRNQGSEIDSPLRHLTPPRWAAQVLREPIALLNDHAHLEKKAATNALELINRHPRTASVADRPAGSASENWVAVMTSVARDEIEHLATVSRLLVRRGGRMTARHRNPYASALRGLVRRGTGPAELIDRLLVSALIELRSCERFDVLAAHGDDRELARLYRRLAVSERGHYQVFVNLAHDLQSGDEVDERWATMLDEESRILEAQPPVPAMHGGVE